MTATPARLYLDLGDLFTKGLFVTAQGRARRLRFPSAVAHTLLRPDAPPTDDDLVLGEGEAPLRPEGFEPTAHPRAASYRGGPQFLREASGRLGGGVALCGWLAAAYGADREVLGQHPTPENVALLTQKALLLCAPPTAPLELVLLVDSGTKARLIAEHARALTGAVTLAGGSLRRDAPRQLRLQVRAQVADAPSCAAAFAHQDPALAGIDRLVLLDVGYFRTKIAIVTTDLGCELQVEQPDLGLIDCVRRVIRDSQDQGLVGDEYAIVRALELRRDVVRLAGRSFAVGPVLDAAAIDLAESVARAAKSNVLGHYNRSGRTCQAGFILGGGAAFIGARLAEQLQRAHLSLSTTRVTSEPSFALVEGARHLGAETGTPAHREAAGRP
ncbi:MAG: hypothetical protein HY906_21050 [Deltaproteobacteria bacterium]|nr:hypothetical protein [Deltaproteobacteria bacterium]